MDPHPDQSSPFKSQIEHAWRDDDWLVLNHKKAVLPRRCLLCDEPTNRRPIRVLLTESHRTVEGCFIWVMFGLLSIVLIGLLQPRVRMRIWLCDKHRKKERHHRLIFWCILLAGIAIPFIGVFVQFTFFDLVNDSLVAIYIAMGTGAFLLLASLVFFALHPQPVSVKKIDKQFIWLENIHPDYLARFPEVPRE